MDKNEVGMNRLLQDLWWRQRNIVFPDTVRNEGIFYRNAARGDQPRDAVQRVGTMMLAVTLLLVGAGYIASVVGTLVEQGLGALIPAIIAFVIASVFFVVGGKLAIAAVFVNARPLHEEIIRRRRLMGRR
jgi:hypothetical protein